MNTVKLVGVIRTMSASHNVAGRGVRRGGFGSLALSLFASLCITLLPAGSSSKADLGKFPTTPLYYRFVAELEHAGAPLKIDVVVSCAQHKAFGRSTGGTSETLGMSAYVFAVPVEGGHAIKVRTSGGPQGPTPCTGATTANGRVPEKWLPLVVWYENADELARGIGYATQDAYRNPSARIGFRSARIETATAEDFDDFSRTGPKNLIPPHLADNVSHLDAPTLPARGTIPDEFVKRPEKAWRYASSPDCLGVRRVRLSSEQRVRVTALWPKDRPRIWSPEPLALRLEFRRKFLTASQILPAMEIYDPRPATEGGYQPPAIYPVARNDALQDAARNPDHLERYAHDAFVGDAEGRRGFVYCDAPAPIPLRKALLERDPDLFSPEGRRKCRIDGVEVPVTSGGCLGAGWIAFENDEFAILDNPSSQG